MKSYLKTSVNYNNNKRNKNCKYSYPYQNTNKNNNTFKTGELLVYAVYPLGLNILCHGRMHNSGKKFSHENNVVDNRKLLCI